MREKLPIFVIHAHDATTMHYDFRLEIDGVLASWAVPKGPSTNPSVKHLAMPTPDHPLEYATFEGVLPPGYGAGPVMIWDTGHYRNIKTHAGKPISMHQALKEGHIEVWLEGKKLKGGYALIRMDQPKNPWLLIKMRDEYANIPIDPVKNMPRSAVTKRTMAEILKAG